MQTILLSLIAGLLALDIVQKFLGNEHPARLVILIPIVLFLILVAGAIIFGIAYGLNALAIMMNFPI